MTLTSPTPGVIAQLVDGASWKTIITLVNTDSTSGTYTIYFYDDKGAPVTLETTAGTASQVSGQLAPYGSRVIETLGQKTALTQGWALVDTSSKIAGNAIFRQSITGRAQYEASLPIMSVLEGNHYLLPFDNISASTGIALVNPAASDITVSISFRTEAGVQTDLTSFSVPSKAHMAFVLADKFPASANQKGVVELSTSSTAMSVLGLRFGAESFTSILPIYKE
jgi:hypothetical protein